jgi:hypothetical protein
MSQPPVTPIFKRPWFIVALVLPFCAGGSGNGPEYVDGPITVSGPDPFDLDRDNDGVACET